MARFRMWKRLSILVVVALLLSLYVVAVPAAETVAAETVIFSEDFEGGLPGDWYVYTAKGWGWLPGSGDARDGCAGTYMIADSYHNQTIDFQSIMYTPSFDCSSYGKVILEFDHDYSAMAGCYPYKADVEVYVGGSPTMVWRCQAGNPVSGHITVDISHVAAGQSDVKIRWWYFATAWNIFWQWEVDNVKVSAPPPDLVVEKEAQCYPDGTFIVGYTVTNDGGTAAGNSTTCKYLGGVLQETQPCPPLGPGDSYVGAFEPEPCPCGDTLEVVVCADNYDEVVESDEDNNCTDINYIECPCPDLLVTEKSESYVDPGAGTYNVTYTVTNQGTATAAASNTTITIDDVDVLEDPVPALTPDESYSNTVGPFTLSEGTDIIKVCADNGAVVDESDENNNCLENSWGTLIVGVTAEVDCDLAVPGATLTLKKDGIEVGSTTSDGGGDYSLPVAETGDYNVIAGKTGYKDQTESITIGQLGQEYTLDFIGDSGMLPTAPNMSYVLKCVNRWLFPPDEECGLTMSTVLRAVNAWLFPT